MKHYEPGTPRVAFALAAVAISVITFALFLVAPSSVESGGQLSATTEARQSVSPAPSAADLPPGNRRLMTSWVNAFKTHQKAWSIASRRHEA
jgi:hypothetical protein